MTKGNSTTSPEISALPVDNARTIARYFQVLADPTRVRLVKVLAEGEWCVSDLTRALDMDQPAVSHQLKYLRQSGLVDWTKSGRHVYYRLSDTRVWEMLLAIIDYLETEQVSV
jgi:DNA-binding transcriptional ArsR family regulator